MTANATPEFSKFRSLFWPIHRHEWAKFFPMLGIYFLIVFNYSSLRTMKEALLITAPKSTAACIPYIKVWAILPMAFLCTYLFTKLSNKFSKDTVFYIMLSAFLGFFLFFIAVLYPYHQVLHPHELADRMQAALPMGCQGLIAIFRNWTFSLFYVMAELWSPAIMTVLFWGFANEVTTVREAKRFYAMLGIGANLATIVAGQVSNAVSRLGKTTILIGADRWEQNLSLLLFIILVNGFFIILLYQKIIGHLRKKATATAEPVQRKEGIKMGIRKNFRYLLQSKYLLCIAVIVLAYNVSLNMVEVVWKDQVRLLCPHPSDYNAYMGNVNTGIGILSTLFAIFILNPSLKRFGWSMCAYFTPVLMLIVGGLFFLCMFTETFSVGTALAAYWGLAPVAFSAFCGAAHNCLSRASKFSFFDVTKEIAFIPLSKECKLKGKAAIDGVCSRMGKSAGSICLTFFLMVFGTIAASTAYVAGVFFIVVMLWLLATRSLGHKFEDLQQETREREAAEEVVPEPVVSMSPKEALSR